MNKWTRILLFGAGAVLAALLIIQLVPYGHAHDNPPVVSEPAWDSPETRALAQRACYDCHSNETVWPWYANVAPVSWLVVHDTEEGRQYLNFSTWGQGGEGEEAEDIVNVIRSGEMPPAQYVLMHPEAMLSADEQQALIQGLSRTLGQTAGVGEREHTESDAGHDSDD